MPFEQHQASGCASPLTSGSWEDDQTEATSCNRNIKRWLASNGSYPRSQFDTTSGYQTADSRIHSLPPTFRGLCLDEMSVRQAHPTGLTARHSIGTLHPYLDAKGNWRYWSEWPGISPSWNTPSALPLSPAPTTSIASPFPQQQITGWPTGSQDTQLWTDPIQHPKDVDPKEVFSTNLLRNYWDSLSPNSPSDYDSHWGPEIDVCSNATSASTLSQCSSRGSWPGPYDMSGDPPKIDGKDTMSPCDQAKVSVFETSANQRPTLQPLVCMSRDAHQRLNANIPKSIPLECQFTAGYESLNPASSTGTGNKSQEFQVLHDARDASKPDPYNCNDHLRGGSLLFDPVDCQTLNPSDIWLQVGNLHASELPPSTTDHGDGAVDQLAACQMDNLDAAFSKMGSVQPQSHLPRFDVPNDTAPSKNSSQPLQEESYGTNNKACAKSRNRLRDEFLVRSKLAGMSYKEIRTKGNFTEAESTLRGRFRTLTKRKEQRVRKPQWQERDVSSSRPSFTCCLCDSPVLLQ